jgi:hypothetical protein
MGAARLDVYSTTWSGPTRILTAAAGAKYEIKIPLLAQKTREKWGTRKRIKLKGVGQECPTHRGDYCIRAFTDSGKSNIESSSGS